MKKRGQSQIITTVLIILLVLASIIIVWQVVKSAVGKSSKTVGNQGDCFDINLEITKAVAGSNNITARLVMDTKSLSKIKVFVNGVIKNESADASSLKGLETEVISLNNGETLKSGDKVEIAAVTKSGYNCQVADTQRVD